MIWLAFFAVCLAVAAMVGVALAPEPPNWSPPNVDVGRDNDNPWRDVTWSTDVHYAAEQGEPAVAEEHLP